MRNSRTGKPSNLQWRPFSWQTPTYTTTTPRTKSTADAVLDVTPSQNVVLGALALKINTTIVESNYAYVSYDTITGALLLPIIGLIAGTDQLVL